MGEALNLIKNLHETIHHPRIGLIGASSAVVSLLVAIPAGRWVAKRNTGLAVFWSSGFYRLGYALWIPLPWLFHAQGYIWALIALTFLMAIPLTPLGVGFNALFAEAVPSKYRAHVAGMCVLAGFVVLRWG